MNGTAGENTAGDGFSNRLCRTLLSDALRDVEYELLEVKSVRILMDYPWVPGKRLRPITFLLSYLSIELERTPHPAVNGRESKLAAATELLHEASLVHDDLVDRSLMRRGKPTMHALNGDGLALLIGDYMVFRGLKLVLDSARNREDIVLAQELANTGLAIAQGEADQLDTFLNRRDWEHRMSMDTYLSVIGKKTAAFFAGCAEGGASLAGAGRELRAVYRAFGMNMGLAFQMLDDLMDVIGDQTKALKTLRNNLNEGTVTLPMIHARTLEPQNKDLEKLRRAERLTPAAQTTLNRLLSSSPVIELCRLTIEDHIAQAREALARMPANIYRAGLEDLLDYVRHCSWGGLEERMSPAKEPV